MNYKQSKLYKQAKTLDQESFQEGFRTAWEERNKQTCNNCIYKCRLYMEPGIDGIKCDCWQPIKQKKEKT